MPQNEDQALNNIACGDPVESGQVHPESAMPSVPVKSASPETKRAALADALRHAALDLLDHNRAAGACIEIEGEPALYILIGNADAIGKLLPESSPGSATDWRAYHSALSQCAELLDNMQDGHPVTETPKYLAEKLAQARIPEAVAHAGGLMANTMFNLSQHMGFRITADQCDSFKDMQRKWDKAIRGAIPVAAAAQAVPDEPTGKCTDHDWPEGAHGTDMDGSCTKCGMSFQRYIHTECP